MERCLTDSVVLAFIEGELGTPDSEHVEIHIDDCSSCRRLISELARRSDAPRATEVSKRAPLRRWPRAIENAPTNATLPSCLSPVRDSSSNHCIPRSRRAINALAKARLLRF
jgi:hypothetical protein